MNVVDDIEFQPRLRERVCKGCRGVCLQTGTGLYACAGRRVRLLGYVFDCVTMDWTGTETGCSTENLFRRMEVCWNRIMTFCLPCSVLVSESFCCLATYIMFYIIEYNSKCVYANSYLSYYVFNTRGVLHIWSILAKRRHMGCQRGWKNICIWVSPFLYVPLTLWGN